MLLLKGKTLILLPIKPFTTYHGLIIKSKTKKKDINTRVVLPSQAPSEVLQGSHKAGGGGVGGSIFLQFFIACESNLDPPHCEKPVQDLVTFNLADQHYSKNSSTLSICSVFLFHFSLPGI